MYKRMHTVFIFLGLRYFTQGDFFFFLVPPIPLSQVRCGHWVSQEESLKLNSPTRIRAKDDQLWKLCIKDGRTNCALAMSIPI